VVVHAFLIGLGLFTVGLNDTTGEVLSNSSRGLAAVMRRLRLATVEVFETDLPRITSLDTRKQLVYVISDQAELIGNKLMQDTKHGVTLLNGKGMYTGNEHGVILCALESRQIKQLKGIVNKIDPKAFVIITPVSDIRGKGFRPLEA
jgi:hypothetical protein